MPSILSGSPLKRRLRRPGSVGLLLLLLLGLTACTPRTQDPDPTESIASQEVDPSLTFDNVTLEQVGEEGALLWVVYAERVTYSGDRQVAQLENPSGRLYRDGEPIYDIEARSGILEQENQRIFLEDEVVVIETRNQVVVRGERMTWDTRGDRLDIQDNVTATHDTAHLQGQQMIFFSDTEHLQVIGEVLANLTEPSLQLGTEELLWQIPEKLVIGEFPVQVARYEWTPELTETDSGLDSGLDSGQSNNPEPTGESDRSQNSQNSDNSQDSDNADESEKTPPPEPRDLQAVTVTDRATAESIEVNLATQVARLQENARLALLDPAVDVVSHRLDWDLQAELLTSDVPLRVTHREKQVVLSGNRGWMNLLEQVFYLQDGIEVLGEENQAQLTANELTWFMASESFEARGNVVYRQVDPSLQLSGPQANGKLEEETFVVSGGDVVTEIQVNPQ
jgi:LPS export ABC transporter protein LptC